MERVKTELNARRDALLKNISSQSTTGTVNESKLADQVLAKIDAINKKIDQKATRTKNMQSLLDQFNTHFEKLSLHCKRIAFKLDHIDVSAGQLCDASLASSSSTKLSRVGPTSDSFSRSLELVDEMRSDLRQNEANILDKVLKPCLDQLETQFLGDLLAADRLEQLKNDLDELKVDIEHLDAACDQKWALLNEAMKSFLDYGDRRGRFDAWLNAFEIKINHFEPVAINLEIVEKQFEQLQQAIDDYEKKSSELDDLNK